jgi:hypothetical protein
VTDDSTESLCEKELRAELGETFDQLRTLPPDAFPEKAKLRKRQDELTQLLREIEIPGAEDMKKDWAEAAAAKRFAEEPVEMIVSPIESGGGGGA